MKKILSIIALISSLSLNAQKTIYLSQLKNTSWKIERNGKIDPEDMYSFNGEKILWYSLGGVAKN